MVIAIGYMASLSLTVGELKAQNAAQNQAQLESSAVELVNACYNLAQNSSTMQECDDGLSQIKQMCKDGKIHDACDMNKIDYYYYNSMASRYSK